MKSTTRHGLLRRAPGVLRLAGTILLAGVVLAGCAARSTPPPSEADVEWRLRSLEENFLQFKELQRGQDDRLKGLQTSLDERLKRLEQELEELKAQQTALVPAEAPVARSSEPRPWDEPPTKAPEPAPAQAPASAQAIAKAKSKIPPPAMAPRTPARSEAKAARSSKAAPEPAGPSGLYEQGLKLVLADKPEEGRKALQDFLAKYPGSSLAPNALYWIGETWYAQKNFPQAILAFKDVTQRFPGHDKAPAALLKIGMAYEAAGDKANAEFYLKALLDKYPRSEPAPLARKKLTALQG